MEVNHFVVISAAIIRYQIAGNFLGLPVMTVPIQTYYYFSSLKLMSLFSGY